MTQIDYPTTEPPQQFSRVAALTYYWDVNTLSAVKGTQPSGGGGGGGAVTVADGADVAEGATTDAEATGNGSVVAILKRLRTLLSGGLPSALVSDRLKVDGSGVTQPVSGTFFQATQPVSAAALPLPSGASTETTLSSLNGKVTAVNTGAVVISSGTVTAVTAITNPVSTKTALTASAPAAATVGVASAQAVASNAARKGLALVNVSNNTISLAIAATAVLNSGVTLYPGGVWEMDEFEFGTGAINAIASAASSPLAIQEWTT